MYVINIYGKENALKYRVHTFHNVLHITLHYKKVLTLSTYI